LPYSLTERSRDFNSRFSFEGSTQRPKIKALQFGTPASGEKIIIKLAGIGLIAVAIGQVPIFLKKCEALNVLLLTRRCRGLSSQELELLDAAGVIFTPRQCLEAVTKLAKSNYG
jgi:hypothetical protein